MNSQSIEEAHDARQVANEFLSLAEETNIPLTPLQVQKLVYFAHAWQLGLYGKPLIDTEFEAWRYGPVVPVVYFGLSHFRGGTIEPKYRLPLHRDDVKRFSEQENDVIRQVFQKYARFSGLQLSAMTHANGTPWDQAVSKRQFYIPNKMIKRYYADQAKKAAHGR